MRFQSTPPTYMQEMGLASTAPQGRAGEEEAIMGNGTSSS